MTHITKTLIRKTLSTALILAATLTTGSAFAQAAPATDLSTAPVNDWVLKPSSTQNQSFISHANAAENGALLTPRPARNPELFTRIETPVYSRFDYTNFKYPLLGPVKLGVQADYQELLLPYNPLQASDITYVTPDSSPYNQTPYQVATTATAQVKFTF